MKPRPFGVGASMLALMLAVLVPAVVAADEDVVSDVAETLRYLIAEVDDADGVLTIDAEPAESNSEQDSEESATEKDKPSKYWIGVKLRPVDEPLRAQLDLPEDVGLVVDSTFEGSPADEAGIKRNDIVLEVGDKKLHDPQKLIEQVEKSGGKELAIKVIRKGKETTVTVTPAPHPHETGSDVLERDDVITWLQDGADPQQVLRHPIGVRFFDRAIVLPHGQSFPGTKLPKGMSVTVHREGSEPAKITVKKGDQEWEVPENELDELPGNIRSLVEPLVRPAPFRLRLDGPKGPGKIAPPPQGPRAPGPPKGRAPVPTAAQEPRSRNQEQQLEELSRQLHQMQRAIEDLRREHDREDRGPRN